MWFRWVRALDRFPPLPLSFIGFGFGLEAPHQCASVPWVSQAEPSLTCDSELRLLISKPSVVRGGSPSKPRKFLLQHLCFLSLDFAFFLFLSRVWITCNSYCLCFLNFLLSFYVFFILNVVLGLSTISAFYFSYIFILFHPLILTCSLKLYAPYVHLSILTFRYIMHLLWRSVTLLFDIWSE